MTKNEFIQQLIIKLATTDNTENRQDRYDLFSKATRVAAHAEEEGFVTFSE